MRGLLVALFVLTSFAGNAEELEPVIQDTLVITCEKNGVRQQLGGPESGWTYMIQSQLNIILTETEIVESKKGMSNCRWEKAKLSYDEYWNAVNQSVASWSKMIDDSVRENSKADLPVVSRSQSSTTTSKQ